MTRSPTTQAAPRTPANARWKWIVGVLLGVVMLLGALLLFFPVDSLRGPLERQISQATGHRVTIGRLQLRLIGFGLGLAADDFQAVAADESQTIHVPELRLGVNLIPLLARRIEVTRVEAPGLVLTIQPARTTSPAAPPARPPVVAAAASRFLAPDIRITNALIHQIAPSGTTRLAGITLTGGFSATASGSVFEGSFAADTVSFAPAASPDRPLSLPSIQAQFRTEMPVGGATAATTLEGSLGTIPAKGTIDSRAAKGRWANRGRLTFEPTDLARIRSMVTGAPGEMLAAYDLGGRFDSGELTFETFTDREEMEYRMTGHLADVTASLPGKGRVVDSGSADIELLPDAGRLTGSFRSGEARLDLNATLAEFAAPRWTARVDLTGPMVEALRFLPPQPDLTVHSGELEAHLTGGGRLATGLPPSMNGSIQLRGVSLTHTSIAVPVDRLDVDVTLAGHRVELRNGNVTAGASDARFSGRMDDWKAPRLDAVINAGTIDLGELFPETRTGTASPPARRAATGSAPSPPVAGRISIDRLIRREVTLTDVTSTFEIDAAGMRLTDLTGQAWGGTVRGHLSLSPKGEETLEYSGELDIEAMRAEDILAAYTPIRGLEGKLSTDLTLSGRNAPGLDPLSVLTLIGKGLVLEGSLVNLPIVRKISEAIQFEPGMAEKISFRTLRHSIRVENGFAFLDSFRVSQPGADWNLGGRIGLDGRLDCPVRARIAVDQFRPGSQLAQAAALVAGSDGRIEIGLHLGGTLTHPDIKVDLAPLLEAAKKKGEATILDELKKRLGDLLKQKP
ncbi:MAG: AsmA-like C-terminal region-containing protein [Candidatus Eisenbacteria bacterium]|nr:AsmA-like C-terminal region-containing protein [Candidatus Eisenbacteria bacterium]